MHIKTKQTTCRIQIQVQKVWFWKKNSIFWLFPIFFPWSHRVKFLFFNFSRFQKKFFFEMASMGPLECWKKQSHEKWAHLGHPLRSHARSSICACGFHPPPMWYRVKGRRKFAILSQLSHINTERFWKYFRCKIFNSVKITSP